MTDSLESAFNELRHVVEADTDCVISNLELMERTNINTYNKYLNMTDAAKRLDSDREHLKTTYIDIERYVSQVNQVVDHVNELEGIVRELDEWSRELLVKSRRYGRK